jgi:hypothetical protein
MRVYPKGILLCSERGRNEMKGKAVPKNKKINKTL